ncbi:MAG: Pr6Pr family membrane protein [Promethearchaeota archaeon]
MTLRNKISFYWRLIFMILGWSNLLLILFVRIFILETEGSLFLAILRPYRYYTIQTNLIASIWLTLSVIFQKKPNKFKKINGSLKGAVVLYITVTFLIYAVFLDKLYTPPTWHEWIVDTSTHYVVPVGLIINYLFDWGEKSRWISLLWWIIYPICYLGFTVIHGTITGDYLYPFFNIPVVGIGGFFMWFGIFLFIFLVFGCLYLGYNRILTNLVKRNSTQKME